MAMSMPKNTPVPMSRRAADPGPEDMRSGTSPSMKASDVITMGHESGNTGLVLGLAFLFVFLFLAAQYESWTVPLAVILSLPVAGVGAYLGIWICGLENNIYFQIGLVMLVGLVAKNAILIVEFAKEEVDKGVDAVHAALTAARLRFRPIVMTSLAFMLGLLLV